MIIALRKFHADRAGSSVIEFALLVGPFLLLLFGIIEFSRALWARQAMLDVTMATARCMAVLQSECTTGSLYSPEKTKAFLLDQSRARGLSPLESSLAFNTNATCDGLPGFSSVAAKVGFDSVYPIDLVVDFSAQSCFLNQS